MSDGPDFLDELHLTDPWIAAITPGRIEAALVGFTLTMAEGWTVARLTSEIQGRANLARGDAPQGDAAAKTELRNLATRAAALRDQLARLGETAENATFFEVMRLKGGTRAHTDHFDYDDDYKPMMLDPLETIANALSRAASSIEGQSRQTTRWSDRHKREQRTDFAVALMPVFEAAYLTPARANNWAAEYGETLPWPDFFRRIYCELFPAAARLNLAEILQDAARWLPEVEAMQRWQEQQDAIRPDFLDE